MDIVAGRFQDITFAVKSLIISVIPRDGGITYCDIPATQPNG